MDQIFTKIQKLRKRLAEKLQGRAISYDEVDTEVFAQIRKAFTDEALMLSSTTEDFHAGLVRIPYGQNNSELFLAKQKETVTEAFTWYDIDSGEQLGPIHITVTAVDDLSGNNKVFDLVQWHFLLSYLMIPAALPRLKYCLNNSSLVLCETLAKCDELYSPSRGNIHHRQQVILFNECILCAPDAKKANQPRIDTVLLCTLGGGMSNNDTFTVGVEIKESVSDMYRNPQQLDNYSNYTDYLFLGVPKRLLADVCERV